jgi:hypothetical protein
MRFPRLLLFALGLACATQCSAAAVRGVEVTPLSGAPARSLVVAGARTQSTNCRQGQYGTAASSLGDTTTGGIIYFGEGDSYWTQLEVSADSCAGCGYGNQAELAVAHLSLFFPYAPETVTVRTSVRQNVPVGCAYPNYIDNNAVIVPPFDYTIDVQDAQTLVDIAIPVPSGYPLVPLPQIDGRTYVKAWLGFEFVAASDTTRHHKPWLAIQTGAKVCATWNLVGGGSPYEWWSEYGVPNPVMYAELAPCELVDVKRTSWGRLKTMYR